MAWVNGQWVDDDELQGMLYSGVTPTLPFYDQSSFTSPLSTLNQEAAGNFNMWGTPAGIRIGEPTTPQATTGSFGVTQDYGGFSPSISMLNDMLANQAPMVDTNIVTDMPSRPVTINDVPFHENMPVVGSNWDDVMPTIQSGQTAQPAYQGVGWDQIDASGIFGTPTVVGGTPATNPVGGIASGRTFGVAADPTKMPVGYSEAGVPMSNENLSYFGAAPVPTSPSMGADYGAADKTGSNLDLHSAWDLGLRMLDPTGFKPGRRTSGDTGPGTGSSLNQTGWTDEGETDITDLMDKHFEDPNATKNIALEIAQTYQDNPAHRTQLWNDAIAKAIGLSEHDVQVANSLLGHVDTSNPNTTVNVASGMGFAPAVTISEESDFTTDYHDLGYGPHVNKAVDWAIKPTQTTTNWVDKPTPTAPAKPAGPTRAELKAAAVAQRKADEATRKAAARRAAAAQKHLEDSRAAAARAQAASAAQAKAAQKAAKAVLSRLGQDRNRPSDREVAAAIEVMSQVDTFGGGSIGFEGGGFDPQGGETGSSGMGAWT